MMLPHKPEDWPRFFVQHLNSGNLEAVVAFYAPNARIRGDIRGNDRRSRQDRDVLSRMIRSKTKLQSLVSKAIRADDVPLLYTDFQGIAIDTSEKLIDIRNNAIEVLCQQRDGCWKVIVGNPNGREEQTSTKTKEK
jgi:hypothetical protein